MLGTGEKALAAGTGSLPKRQLGITGEIISCKKDGHFVHEGHGQGMLVGSGSGRAAAAELLRFNLSQPVASVIIGCEQMALLGQNIKRR